MEKSSDLWVTRLFLTDTNKFKFARESLGEVLDTEKNRLEELLAENFQEGKPFIKQFFSLNVDWDSLLKVEEMGNMAVYSCRTSEGLLVGYALAFAQEHFHHKGKVFASLDPIFISKKYRVKAVGAKFLKWLINDVRKAGAHVLTVSAKPDHSFNKLLSRMKLTPVDTTYAVVLNKE